MALSHFYFNPRRTIMARKRRVKAMKASHLKKGRKVGRKGRRGKRSAIKA
jgi:hypothetical protein